ncbi:MAG TPA: diguanylate cyclase [Chroococcidiopsis sp.]
MEHYVQQLIVEIRQLRQEVAQLKRSNQDLQAALAITAEHGDLIEAQLFDTNRKLKSEVEAKEKAKTALAQLLDVIGRERDDLEVIVQTIMEHGDVLDVQWTQKLNEANQLASVDGLTQIANRRKFDEYLEHEWKRSLRDHLPLSVIFCDIDHFKEYNDTYGHLAGDSCLSEVAQVLTEVLCRPRDLIARYGGEEFAVILPQTDLKGAVLVAHRMQEAIQRRQIAHARSPVGPYLTFSMGVACIIPNAVRSPRDLIDQADQRLYRSKQRGKNQIVSESDEIPPDLYGSV